MNAKSKQRSAPEPARLIDSLYVAAAVLSATALTCCIFGGAAGPIRWLCAAGLMGIGLLVWRWFRVEACVRQVRRLAEDTPAAQRTDPAELVTGYIRRLNGNISKLQNRLDEVDLQLRLCNRNRLNAEAIIFGIRDAVIVTDAYGSLLMANQRAGELFGFDHQTCGRQPVEKVISHDPLVELMAQSRKNKARHIRQEIELLVGAEQKVFECIISCIDPFPAASDASGPETANTTYVIKHTGNDASQVVAVLHDITSQKEVAAMKNEFISHVSHELKTPLASINAYAEMLAEGEAEDEQTTQEFCSIIQDQAARLSRLIEDILDISRIESGLIKINKEPVSVTVLIKEAVEMIRGYAAEKNITLRQPSPIVMDQVLADRDMLQRVIINLLSNAVKYTPQSGSVTVDASLDEAEQRVRVTVTDTGVGIAPEELGQVFEKFYRVGANNKYAKGTGLGLNLVKQIVEKVHEGRVFVTSRPGEGSTFGFELPAVRAMAAQTV